MDKVRFVDQTIRDAQQSLWGNLMKTDHILPVAETMDRVGYLEIATVGSQAFTIQVRNHGEDPWERIRLLAARMPSTPLRGSYQTASLSSFDLGTPRDIIALWIKRSVANGIRSFWICDYQATCSVTWAERITEPRSLKARMRSPSSIPRAAASLPEMRMIQ